MPSMANLISKHNTIVLKSKANFSNTTPSYKASYPLKGKCRKTCITYKTTLTSDDNTKHYFGSCETEFKARFYNHNKSFKYQRKSNAADLSKAFWGDKKLPNHLENSDAYHPLPTRDKGLHAVPHREVRNSPIMPQYIVEQKDRTDGKMPPC